MAPPIEIPETGVVHWYDFICPFCYVAQSRNAILIRHGIELIELPFQPHPDIPAGGIPARSRVGPIYTMLEREAKNAGLPLRWPARLPNTRQALAAAEWTRRNQPHHFPEFHKSLFAAHFVLGEDVGDKAVILRHASTVGVDLPTLNSALSDGSAMGFVAEAEAFGREHGIQGTPAWLVNQRLFSGLCSAEEFDFLEIPSRVSRLQALLGLVTPFQAFGAGCTRVDIQPTTGPPIDPDIAALRTALREGWAFQD